MREVVAYTSPTCAPCRQLKPELQFQSQQRGFKLTVLELGSATAGDFAAAGVRAVPVTVLLEDGQEVDRFSGGMTPTAIESKLVEWLL
jgi:thioredoxin-like negative regulator of GroEL